jgi:hypothetical protein
MSNFVQATEYDVYMYAKFEYFPFVCIFVNKYPKIWIIGIIYKAILHKIEFSLYFSDVSTNFYELWNPIRISVI